MTHTLMQVNSENIFDIIDNNSFVVLYFTNTLKYEKDSNIKEILNSFCSDNLFLGVIALQDSEDLCDYFDIKKFPYIICYEYKESIFNNSYEIFKNKFF